MVKNFQCICDQACIHIQSVRISRDLLCQGPGIDHLVDNAVVLPDLDHIKSDRRRDTVNKSFLCHFPVLIDLFHTVALAEIDLNYGLRIQLVNNAVPAFAEHFAAFYRDFAHGSVSHEYILRSRCL